MKARYLLIILPLVYGYGLLTVTAKVFPFEQIQTVKHALVGIPDIRMVETGRYTVAEDAEEHEDRLVLVTYGQSNAVNTGQLGYEVKHPVYMVFDGDAYNYADPALGGTGVNASVWGRVGDNLVDQGITSSVFFVNTGWGAASIWDLGEGHRFDFFADQIRQAQARYGKIDGILMHHGERNHHMMEGSDTYRDGFQVFNDRVRALTDAPIYLSQVSYCGVRKVDETLLSIQDRIIREVDGVLRGPNSDLLLEVQYRLPDQCHFSARGLDVLAEMWTDSVTISSEY